jgi:hypothetical protein
MRRSRIELEFEIDVLCDPTLPADEARAEVIFDRDSSEGSVRRLCTG